MDLLPLPGTAVEGLRARRIHPDADLAIRVLLTCLHESCQTVSEDCGPDRYDSATSEGGLRHWRTRNRVLRELRRDHPELETLIADASDNALRLVHGGTSVTFWSAPDGVSTPRLGASKNKRRTVNEMQLQIAGTGTAAPLAQLALLYEADEFGLREASVGVLGSRRHWHWEVGVFRRAAGEQPARASRPATPPPTPAHDAQPVPDLPPVLPRRREAPANEQD